MRRTRSSLKLFVLGLLGVLGITGLTALGIWQLERRVWKHELIERVAQRIHAAPVAARGPAEWPLVSAAHDEYRRVSATGQFINDRETLVRAVTTLGGGFWVMTPFQTVDGFTVLVNRGFVPPERRDRATRTAGQIPDQTVVTGLVRMTEPKGGFLRANDPATDRWYSRDVAAIASARKLSAIAPYFIDADAMPVPGGLPVGGLTVLAFPDNHLQYAVTWFALAVMLAVALVLVWRDERRLRAQVLICYSRSPRHPGHTSASPSPSSIENRHPCVTGSIHLRECRTQARAAPPSAPQAR